MFFKTGVLKNFAMFTGKSLCWSLILIICFIKKILQHRYFSVNIAKFLKTALFIEHLRWLLLVQQQPWMQGFFYIFCLFKLFSWIILKKNKIKRLVSKTQALAKLFFSRTIVEEIKQVLGDIIEMEVKVKM